MSPERVSVVPRIEREVRGALAQWRTVAEGIGIARRELERLAAVIEPELE